MTCACAIALKIAKILAAQVSAQPFEYNCGASTIATEIVAAQVPTFGPPCLFTQNAFLEHHVTTRQQPIMEKGIITFNHNSRLKFLSTLCEIAQQTESHHRSQPPDTYYVFISIPCVQRVSEPITVSEFWPKSELESGA